MPDTRLVDQHQADLAALVDVGDLSKGGAIMPIGAQVTGPRESDARTLVAAGLTAFTPNTIVDRPRLRDDGNASASTSAADSLNSAMASVSATPASWAMASRRGSSRRSRIAIAPTDSGKNNELPIP